MSFAATRDLDHRVLGGVCAGIASHYRKPVAAVRAATIALSVVTAGVGGLAYLALWRWLPATVAGATAPVTAAEAAPRAEPALAAPAAVAERATPATGDAIYGPVAADLPRVAAQIRSISQGVELPLLDQMLTTTLTGSGKMLRPAIALLAGRTERYELDRLVPLAASVELLHTATLVHDDVIDEASARRGETTPNALFGNAASVMLGDYMFAHAADFIARTDDPQIVRRFAQTLMMMANGELTQDVSAFEYSADVQRYLDRITGKTASLFGTAAEGGAMVAGRPPQEVEALRLYGLRLGIAFQIVDDVLDFTGDPEVMGKPVGSDLTAGTLTLPAILYLQRQPEDNPIKRAFAGQRARSNFERAIREIQASDVIDESMTTARRFGDDARAALATLPDSEARTTLDGLIDYVFERRS